MTITMTTKNQITIPKKIVDALELEKGSLFDVRVIKNHIELIPLEIAERVLTEEDYQRLDKLVGEEKRKKTAKKVTRKFIKNIK